MTAEGRESYRESKAKQAAAEKAGTGYYKTHNGGGGGSSKTVYFYNPTTKHYTYRVGGGSPGSGWQSVGTTQPAGYTSRVTQGTLAGEPAQARIAELQQSKGHYYNPITKVITTQRVSGQRPMTKTEAQHYQSEYTSKGLSPYQTSSGKQLTTEEHKKL